VKQVRILLLGTQMEVAGAQRMLLSQARWFDMHGYKVKAVFFYDKQGLQKTWQAGEKFPVLSLEGWRPNGFILFALPGLIRALLVLLGAGENWNTPWVYRRFFWADGARAWLADELADLQCDGGGLCPGERLCNSQGRCSARPNLCDRERY
jgi:hypothetical protein